MTQDLVFLFNEFMCKELQDDLRLPLTFVAFAHVDGKLYSHHMNRSCFITTSGKRTWGNSVIYGALYHLEDAHYYYGLLDAYHSCSMSSLYRNHNNDLHHRISMNATPIHFNTLDELARLQYIESEITTCHAYVGNPIHPKIQQRIKPTKWSYRLIDGIDKHNFIKNWEETTNATK